MSVQNEQKLIDKDNNMVVYRRKEGRGVSKG